MHQRLIGEICVLKEAQRIEWKIASQHAGGYFRRIRVESAVGQAPTLRSQVPGILRSVVVEQKSWTRKADGVGANTFQLRNLALRERAVVGQRERNATTELVNYRTSTFSHAIHVRVALEHIHLSLVMLQAVANIGRQIENIFRWVGWLWMNEWDFFGAQKLLE